MLPVDQHLLAPIFLGALLGDWTKGITTYMAYVTATLSLSGIDFPSGRMILYLVSFAVVPDDPETCIIAKLVTTRNALYISAR